MSWAPWEGEHGLSIGSLPELPVPYRASSPPPPGTDRLDLWQLPVPSIQEGLTVGDVLTDTATDAWVVVHEGSAVWQWHRPGTDLWQAHPLWSISKTVIGMLVGRLADHGLLRPSDEVVRYVPELASSGYAGATIRHLLDMRSGVRFREDYADPGSHIRHLDAAIAGLPGAAAGLKSYLVGLEADRPHGGPFQYRSCETDVLGWVCERAAGARVPELVGRLFWGPMGAAGPASFLADVYGTAIYDGGMLAAARDVARFGEVLLAAGQWGGHDLIPRGWISSVWDVEAELRAAFASSAAGPYLPGGWYRNQCWVVPGPHGDVLLGLGIHGQLLRVDPATRTVMVKLSSWRTPQDPRRLYNTLRACEAVAAQVSGRAAARGPRFGSSATGR